MFRIFILIVAGIRIVISVIFGFRPLLRVAVPEEVTVPLEGGGAIVAELVRKGWGWGGFSPVGGTVKLRTPIPSHFLVSTFEITTTVAAPDAIFTVLPQKIGTGQVQVWGKSTYGNHVSLFSSGPWVRVTVTG